MFSVFSVLCCVLDLCAVSVLCCVVLCLLYCGVFFVLFSTYCMGFLCRSALISLCFLSFVCCSLCSAVFFVLSSDLCVALCSLFFRL